MKAYLLFGRVTEGSFNIPCTMYETKEKAVSFAESRHLAGGAMQYVVHEIDIDPDVGMQSCDVTQLAPNGEPQICADRREIEANAKR